MGRTFSALTHKWIINTEKTLLLMLGYYSRQTRFKPLLAKGYSAWSGFNAGSTPFQL